MTGILPEEVRVRPKVPLAGDPLAVQVRSGIWNPFPLFEPTATARLFVDWGQVSNVLANSSGDFLSRDLRPLLLNHWLKGIEKG
jgi:hypothetical protein